MSLFSSRMNQLDYVISFFQLYLMLPENLMWRIQCKFFWTKPGLSISRQAINYWQMRSLQRGASPSDQGRTFACRQRRTKCIQFRYALPWRPKHAARPAGKLRDDGLHPSTTGSKRGPRTGSSLENVSPRQLDRDRQFDHHAYTHDSSEHPLLPESNNILSVFRVSTSLWIPEKRRVRVYFSC